MEFNEVIKNRYSCKNFNEQKVSEEKLNKILEAARLAPTAKNLQEQHIYVVEAESGLAKIDELTPCRYHASTVLIVTYNTKNVFIYPGEEIDSGMEDASIVATHLLLAAYNEGVDSCWVNFFNPKEVKDAFNLSDDEEVVMMLDLGYACKDSKPLPTHFDSKELKDMVTFIK